VLPPCAESTEKIDRRSHCGCFPRLASSSTADHRIIHLFTAVKTPNILLCFCFAFVTTAQSQNQLSFGKAAEGAIRSSDDEDTFEIPARRGEVLHVVVEAIGKRSFSPSLELFDPNGTRIGFDRGADEAAIRGQVTVSGIHTAVVGSGKGGPGLYRISLESHPGRLGGGDRFPGREGRFGNRRSDQLFSGTDERGQLRPGEEESWTFSADAGSFVILAVGQLAGQGFEPNVEVVDPRGKRVAQDSGDFSADVAFRTSDTGRFRVIISDDGRDSAASYRISLAIAPQQSYASPDEGGPLASNRTARGSLDRADLDLWTFFAAEGEPIKISLRELPGEGFEPRLDVIDPQGNRIALDSAKDEAEISERANRSGLYTIVVSDSQKEDSGPYALLLHSPAQDDRRVDGRFPFRRGHFGDRRGERRNRSFLSPGVEVTNTIGGRDEDVWYMDLDEGVETELRARRLSGGPFTPVIRVLDPDEREVALDSGRTEAEVSFEADTTGIYTVLISDESRKGTGRYGLTLETDSKPRPGRFRDPRGRFENRSPQRLIPGQRVAGSFRAGQENQWWFQARQGEEVRLTMVAMRENDYVPMIEVRGPDGQQVGYDTGRDEAEASFRISATGDYTVTVAGEDRNRAGSYLLLLEIR